MLHQQQEIPDCSCAPQNLNPCVALHDKFWRLTIGLLMLSKLYLYTRTSLSMVTTWFHIWRTFFLQSRTLTVRPFWQLASFLFLGHDDFSQKNMQDLLFFAPVLTNKIPGRKLFASANYQTGTIGNDGVSDKALGILPALFHGPLHACCIRKNIRTRYCTTLLNYYFKLLLHCSVPGTDSCTTSVLYYCTTAVLSCTVAYYCTELYWCAVLLHYRRVPGTVLLLYVLLILYCSVLY